MEGEERVISLKFTKVTGDAEMVSVGRTAPRNSNRTLEGGALQTSVPELALDSCPRSSRSDPH